MKTSIAKKVHYESGPNMTPLVDVVMVILIFLMLAGCCGSSEHYMIGSADLHSAGLTPRPVSPTDVQPILMHVSVDDFGNAHFDWDPNPCKAVAAPGEDQQPFSQRLADSIGRKYREVLQNPDVQSRRPDGKNLEDEVELIIQAGGKAKWDQIAPVYDAALQAKVKKIGFR
jgi:biopolymer transport protein ExbD